MHCVVRKVKKKRLISSYCSRDMRFRFKSKGLGKESIRAMVFLKARYRMGSFLVFIITIVLFAIITSRLTDRSAPNINIKPECWYILSTNTT